MGQKQAEMKKQIIQNSLKLFSTIDSILDMMGNNKKWVINKNVKKWGQNQPIMAKK